MVSYRFWLSILLGLKVNVDVLLSLIIYSFLCIDTCATSHGECFTLFADKLVDILVYTGCEWVLTQEWLVDWFLGVEV